MSPSEYVGIMQDTMSSRKHLVVIRSMGELDKNAIAKRLGKFSRAAQDAWVASQSKEEQQRMTERRETSTRGLRPSQFVSISVMPWASRADLMLQLQLSYMLSRDDFWTKQSYLRVCSIVGDFSKLGFDDGAETSIPVMTKAERHAELHEEVWRRMRIPATIEVFDVVEAAHSVWEAETAGFAQDRHRCDEPTRQPQQPSAAMSRVLNTAIRSREFITICRPLTTTSSLRQLCCAIMTRVRGLQCSCVSFCLFVLTQRGCHAQKTSIPPYLSFQSPTCRRVRRLPLRIPALRRNIWQG